jgi:chromosome partitioning protein
MGWPQIPRQPRVERLGWPTDGPAPAPSKDHQGVSRETSGVVAAASGASVPAVESRPVSRETDAPESANSAPTVSATSVTSVTPATSPAGTAAPYRTAGDLATASGGLAPDPSTPLARSVEHSLLVREGRRLGEAMARPARTRVMVVANQKGGVGKTTTAVNMAAALAQHGLRVLVLDLDPQGNASTALGVDHHRGTPSTYDALVEGRPLVDVVQPSPEIGGLFVVPATIDLAGAEIELVSMVAREGRLRRALHAHPWVFGVDDDRFDYVLIDCPPSLGLLTLNALVAGDEMLIPIQAEYYALEGLGQLLETVEMVRAHLNPDLSVSTIVLTMFDARTRLSAGVAEEVRSHFPEQVLRTAIPRSVRISEAPSYGQTVMTYDPGSPGALSYLEAARELASAATTTAGTDEGACA